MVIVISIIVSILLGIYCHLAIKRYLIVPNALSSKFLWGFNLFFIFSSIFRYFYRVQTKNVVSVFLIKFSYVSMSFIGFIILCFIFLDIYFLCSLLLKKIIPNPRPAERRKFLKEALTLGGLFSVTGATLAGYQNSFNPNIQEVDIPLKLEHADLDGLKIVQLSDVHIGPYLGKDFATHIVTEVNKLNPDIIVITGDFIDGNYDFLSEDLEPFSKLSAPLGVYFVTGNHEYYWGGEVWLENVKRLGMIPLPNSSVVLPYKNTSFALAGVNDISSLRGNRENKHDPAKAIKGLTPEIFKILLAHQPRTCYEASSLGFHLQLSGHTHAGQAYPYKFLVALVQEYMQGLYNHEGMWLYVNAGTGFWGPPNRLGINSEISLLRLKTKTMAV